MTHKTPPNLRARRSPVVLPARWSVGFVRCVAGVSALALSAVASAQLAGQPDYREVEAGLSDANPLSGGGRFIPRDLREAIGFERVFRVGDSNLFARRSGALTAVFDRSVYANTRDGPVAIVPPGTVYYIGDPPAAAAPAERRAIRRGEVDLRQDLRVDARVEQRINTAPVARDDRPTASFRSSVTDLRPARRAIAWLRDAPFWHQIGRY